MPPVVLSPDSPPQLLSRREGPSRVAVIALWIFIALGSLAMTSLAQVAKAGRVDLVERVIWEAGWVGWIALTYLVLEICRRHPIDRQRKLTSVARLAIYGLGVVLLQIAFDFACNTTLGRLLKGTPLTWSHLLYITVYKAHLYYGVYWMIVGAAHAYEFHARYLKSQLLSSQLEVKLANAELSLLKGQLQPHFLFNTHNSIVSLMLKNDNPAAIRMLTRLSDLLRISLSHSRQQLVQLREELATLRLYLEIQHERFRDRLEIKVEVPENLHDAELPHLILQPLVENALSHGLGDVTEDGQLSVSGRREGDRLILRVSDNGAGFDIGPGGRRSRPQATGGVGLTNTQERLQQLYGDAQSLEIESRRGQGCVVTIWIPYHCAKPKERETV